MHTIKIVHPLCATELRNLDLDVLRAIAVHLRRCIGKRATSTSNRKEAVRQAENASLGMVEREIGSRMFERRRDTDGLSHFDEVYAASGLQKDDRPPIPLHGHSPDFCQIAEPEEMPTPPTRTVRPEFDTRGAVRRTSAVSEQGTQEGASPRSSDDTTKTNPVYYHPDGDSYGPVTDTFSGYDCRGEYMGQYPVNVRDMNPRSRQRDDRESRKQM